MGDEHLFGDIASLFQKGDGLDDPRVWPEIHVIKMILLVNE
jgi:hypothetical protein